MAPFVQMAKISILSLRSIRKLLKFESMDFMANMSLNLYSCVMKEGYFGVCGIAVSGVISARYCGIKGKNWRYCGIEFLQRGMRYR